MKPPSETPIAPPTGSYLTPRFEDARVYDAMRKGIFTCPPDTSLREVARMMATYHIHSVVVTDLEGEQPWGLLTAVDLVRSAGPGFEDQTAGESAATEVVSVMSDDTLPRAAQLMAEHETSHLLVLHSQTGNPVGVISTLDVAGVLAWGEG
jgi:CBS domain-containing protein